MDNPAISRAYVLAKNEANNIERCLQSLAKAGIPTTVLDSGSTDATKSICGRFAGVRVENFEYRNHCESYNTITSRHGTGDLVVILDADMQVSSQVLGEAVRLFADADVDAAEAPTQMYWDGHPLNHCSLYPPKCIMFRGGKAHFKPSGHGERLIDHSRSRTTRSKIIHDDRKPLEQVLSNQWRYARDVVRRGRGGKLTFKDRLKLRTPLMIFIVPLYALIVKRGFLDGRAGFVYMMDRLIAEALTFRASLSRMVEAELDAEEVPGNAALRVPPAPVSSIPVDPDR